MTVEQAARDFFGWFNRHYPEPSTNPDHEWNRLGVALTNHQEEAQVRGLCRTANNSIHTCSYYCSRPECVRQQRDELFARAESDTALLREALYALEYAHDITKLEGLQGCGCPICTNIAALRNRLEDPCTD